MEFLKGCSCKSAAEQKARTTYDNILRLVKDPDVVDPIRFLREREIVHFQRFGEGLRKVQDELDSKNSMHSIRHLIKTQQGSGNPLSCLNINESQYQYY